MVETLSEEVLDTGVGKEVRLNIIFSLGGGLLSFISFLMLAQLFRPVCNITIEMHLTYAKNYVKIPPLSRFFLSPISKTPSLPQFLSTNIHNYHKKIKITIVPISLSYFIFLMSFKYIWKMLYRALFINLD